MASKRYFIQNWRCSAWLHALSGTAIVGVTIYSFIDLYREYGFSLKNHAIFGYIALVLSVVVGLTGLITFFFSRCHRDKSWARFELWKIFGSMHTFLGYLTLTLCVGVNSGGMVTYALHYLNSKMLYQYAFYNFYFIIGIVLSSEITYRCWRKTRVNSKFVLNKKYEIPIALKELELRAARGENLVILENLVLDFSDYAAYHPGGKFLLEKNRGRDITKFYYGAYAIHN